MGLEVKKVDEHDSLHISLGITDERNIEICKKIHHLLIDNTDIPIIMEAISKEIKHPNELAYACFTLGAINNRSQSQMLQIVLPPQR